MIIIFHVETLLRRKNSAYTYHKNVRLPVSKALDNMKNICPDFKISTLIFITLCFPCRKCIQMDNSVDISATSIQNIYNCHHPWSTALREEELGAEECKPM